MHNILDIIFARIHIFGAVVVAGLAYVNLRYALFVQTILTFANSLAS
jgi:hypothetical protein